MLPRAEWGRHEYEAPVEGLDLAVEVSRWSGVSTSHELFTATWD